jgi:hypothetical protein
MLAPARAPSGAWPCGSLSGMWVRGAQAVVGCRLRGGCGGVVACVRARACVRVPWARGISPPAASCAGGGRVCSHGRRRMAHAVGCAASLARQLAWPCGAQPAPVAACTARRPPSAGPPHAFVYHATAPPAPRAPSPPPSFGAARASRLVHARRVLHVCTRTVGWPISHKSPERRPGHDLSSSNSNQTRRRRRRRSAATLEEAAAAQRSRQRSIRCVRNPPPPSPSSPPASLPFLSCSCPRGRVGR